jgi:hypothetical protein
MATYNDEQIEQIVRRLSTRTVQTTERTDCPDENSLAGYLTGALTDQARGRLEEHFAHCAFCLSEVVAVNQVERAAETLTVPRWLTERAMALVKPAAKGNVVDLVVRLIKETVELVSTAGEWMVPFTAQPIAVRGASPLTKSGMLQVEKEIAGHKVGVDVEQVETGVCQVVVTVATPDGKAQDGIRLTLVAGDREQASYLTKGGQAVFERLSKGQYDLVISQAATSLGTIRLAIESD